MYGTIGFHLCLSASLLLLTYKSPPVFYIDWQITYIIKEGDLYVSWWAEPFTIHTCIAGCFKWKTDVFHNENKLKFISYIFNLLDRNQINSLYESNPNLLDESIDIEIFNPSSIDYPYLVNEIKEYWNYFFCFYRIYPKEYRKLIPIFEKLSFKEKKDVLIELFLILEHDELLPDNSDSLK